ncbi:MAG: histone deacetylase, partial [Candidatus Eremiobacteraeota bacterium]|nr:histone deacetylase [Candidatus Eremiobacteraeota bacterium]
MLKQTMQSAVIYSEKYKLHKTGEHIEVPERMDAVINGLKSSPLWGQVPVLPPRPAVRSELELVHEPAMIEFVEQVCSAGGGILDYGDTVASPESYDIACLAAGGALLGIEYLKSGKYDAVSVLCRPPGHHATPKSSLGFCIFNNAAIATRYALSSGYEKIGIVDWDVHHGNGTQDTFYDEPRVLYTSTHRFPFYPGSGRLDETGEGAGTGFTVNIPLPAGCGNAEYIAAYQEVIIPALKRFGPDLLVVSAGFDNHCNDPLGGMNLDDKSYAEIASMLCQFHVPILMVLEGGYDHGALAASIPLVISAWQKNGKIGHREHSRASLT